MRASSVVAVSGVPTADGCLMSTSHRAPGWGRSNGLQATQSGLIPRYCGARINDWVN